MVARRDFIFGLYELGESRPNERRYAVLHRVDGSIVQQFTNYSYARVEHYDIDGYKKIKEAVDQESGIGIGYFIEEGTTPEELADFLRDQEQSTFRKYRLLVTGQFASVFAQAETIASDLWLALHKWECEDF